VKDFFRFCAATGKSMGRMTSPIMINFQSLSRPCVNRLSIYLRSVMNRVTLFPVSVLFSLSAYRSVSSAYSYLP
jgi:hypothetical protein